MLLNSGDFGDDMKKIAEDLTSFEWATISTAVATGLWKFSILKSFQISFWISMDFWTHTLYHLLIQSPFTNPLTIH